MAKTLLAVLFWLGAQDRMDQTRQQTVRAADFIVLGNRTTPTQAILDQIDLYPGMVIPGRLWKWRTELKLLAIFYERFDPVRGNRPRVQWLQPQGESDFRDLLIRFPERKRKKP